MALYLYPNFFFYLFFSMTKYLVFNIFCMYFMFLCSIYVQNLQQVLYVFWKFCVPYCLVLFTFIFNLCVTNDSMCIVMMIGKNNLGKFCRFFLRDFLFPKCFNTPKSYTTADKHSQLYHTFFEYYIYRANILTERFFENNFITYFLISISFRNKIKYKRASINSFITHLFSLIAIGSKL